MVAELRSESTSLPLLFPPDKPEPHGRCQGWRRTQYESARADASGLYRDHAADEYGARVQHAIVRYVFGQVRRSVIANEFTISETNVGYYLRGAIWGAYGRPVLRALRRLGITPGRGDWKGGERQREIIAANQSVMRRAIDALEGPPIGPDARDKLLADLYLLTVAAEDRP